MDDNEGKPRLQPQDPLVQGRDFYWDEGYMVLTAAYLTRRGYCCQSGCRHCPYGFKKPKEP